LMPRRSAKGWTITKQPRREHRWCRS
jgi:hypothetical protein